MADCTIRRVEESWIEVVLPTPTYAGELGKAHRIMLGQLGCGEGVIGNDDDYMVIVGDDEIILRAKAPKRTLKVSWADERIQTALAVLLDYRDGNINDHRPFAPDSDLCFATIDCLRAVLGVGEERCR